MTLVTPTADGSTTTGREVEDLSLNLGETRDNIEDLNEKVGNAKKLVEGTRWALEQVSEVEDQASDFLATIKSMQFALKISGKVGPLKLPSKFVEQVLGRLEDVAVSVRDKARKMERKIEDGEYIEKLERAEDKLEAAEDRLSVAEFKVNQYAQTANVMVFAFDAVGTPLDPIESAANAASTPVNDVLVPINQLYNEIEEDLQFLDDAFTAASSAEGLFDALAAVARDFGAINTSLSVLSGPLQAIQNALSPIEWVLDAVGFIYDITVGPVIDFLLDKLGVTAILNKIGDAIAALLPDVDVLNEMEARILDAFADLETFIGGFDTDIDDFIGDITDDVLNALNALAPDAIRFGSEDKDVMYGRTDGLDLMNGLEGNDTLYGYAQGDGPASATDGDLFIASSGDDFNYGGAGTDWLVLRGTLDEYRITQFSETAPVVFQDLKGRWGREVAEGIEQFVFNDGVYTIEDLQELGALSSPETNGDDLIIGGEDDDVIAPLAGSDTVDGRGGSDTYLLPVGQFGGNIDIRLQWAISDAAGKEYDGFAWDGRDRDYLDSIENITVELDRSAKMRGTDGDNILISGAGEDIHRGLAGDDMLFGGDEEDWLIGGEGSDTVFAGEGKDIVFGAAIAAGQGNRYDGGVGTFDRLTYSEDRNYFNFDVGNEIGRTELFSPDAIRFDASTGLVEHMDGATLLGSDTVSGFEYIIGSDGDDTITGHDFGDGSANSTFDGGDGDDLIYTGDADEIYGGFGSDTVIMTEFGATLGGGQKGSGDSGGDIDTLDLRQSVDARWLIRNGFNSRVEYKAYGDFEVERLANDFGAAVSGLIELGSGTFDSFEVVLLGDGNDEFHATGTSRVEIYAAGGDDIMIRRQGNDGGAEAFLHGGDGNDYIEFVGDGNEAYGDAGNDRLIINTSERDIVLEGGTGDDFFRIIRGIGTLDGGDGYDVVSLETRFAQPSDTSTVDLLLETASLDGIDFDDFKGVEEVIGGDEARDTFRGSNDAERFVTRGGNDILEGRDGSDELFGGDGNDSLDGGNGNDLLHGGAGDDELVGGVLPNEIDTASYSNARFDGEEGELTAGDFGAVQVNLTTGRATGAQGNDTLENIENVIGSSASDFLRGNGFGNVLTGGDGDDTLEGLNGDDVLVMGEGEDIARGGAGDDTITVGLGNSVIEGGTGIDLLNFGTLNGTVTIDLEGGTYTADLIESIAVWRNDGSTESRVWNGNVYTPLDIIETEAAFANSDDDLTREVPGIDDDMSDLFEVTFEDFVITYTGTFTGIEEFITSEGGDIITGSALEDLSEGGLGNDTMRGGGGADFLKGEEGNDSVDGGFGFDTVDGGLGNDSLAGGAGADMVYGQAGNDEIFGNSGLDTIMAGEGDDFVSGGFSTDEIHGEDGHDELQGRSGADTLHGGDGNDTLRGSEGRDEIYGGRGADEIYGATAADTLYGDSGDDTVFGSEGRDSLFGGKGNDELSGGSGADTLSGDGGDDEVRGNTGADVLYGGNGNDSLFGGSASDALFGGAGDDLLVGQLGADTLTGEEGNDTLRGGGLADVFVFDDGFDVDLIEDFEVTEDILQFSRALTGGLTDGDDIIAAFADDSGASVVFDFGGGDQVTLASITSLTGLADQIEVL